MYSNESTKRRLINRYWCITTLPVVTPQESKAFETCSIPDRSTLPTESASQQRFSKKSCRPEQIDREIRNYGVEVFQGDNRNVLLKSPFGFSKHGQCGMEMSDLVPHLENRTNVLIVIYEKEA